MAGFLWNWNGTQLFFFFLIILFLYRDGSYEGLEERTEGTCAEEFRRCGIQRESQGQGWVPGGLAGPRDGEISRKDEGG